jgi:hypothetical protein
MNTHTPLSRLLFVFFILLQCITVFGQSLPVGTNLLDDAFRRGQLLGKVDPAASFTVRPLHPDLIDLPEGQEARLYPEYSGRFFLGDKGNLWKPELRLLPVTWKQQYNSDHPEGLNDGAMIPARGYQTLLSTGFYARMGWFSLQLQPEFVWAENKAFDGFPDEHPDAIWRLYNTLLNNIDLPERFGETAYNRLFWGQSSLRFTYRSLSLGLSNENLWWGPGIKNSLLMTNNAPGFKHLTFNTVRPVKSPIGSFEWQLVAGRLVASGYPGLDTLRLKQHGIAYKAKPDDWRYLNGIVFSYQPRWFPGLFLGASRSFLIYHDKLGTTLSDYLPVFTLMTKKSVNQELEDSKQRNQLASVFMRWVAPEAHMEAYFEYGREDHNYHLVDVILEPDHLRAYIIGLRKLTPLKRSDEFIDIQLEVAHFAKNQASTFRAPGVAGRYRHGQVVHGYTHIGQILGSGIGTGSNMQSFSIAWVKGLKRMGFEFKRVSHEENFWAYAFKDYRYKWADLGGALVADWHYKKFLFNARVETIGSINYQFFYDPVPDSDILPWWNTGKPRYNLHATLGVTYCF